MLAADHAAERHRPFHDRVRGAGGPLHHGPVVGEHRDVDVHVAVTGVHVGGDDDAPLAYLGEDAGEVFADAREAAEQFEQLLLEPPQVGLGAQGGRVPLVEPLKGPGAEFVRLGQLGLEPVRVLDGFGRGQIGHDLGHHVPFIVQVLGQVALVHEAGELGQGGERQDDVLVQLEGVGAGGDGTQPLAVAPEPLGLVRIAGDEDLGVGVAGHERDQPCLAAQDLLGGVGHHVDEQHRLGRFAARGLELVVDRPDVLLVEVLQRHQRLFALVDELLGDLHDHPAGLVHVRAEELQAAGELLLVGRVEDELGIDDDPVRALLLHAGQAAQGLVGDVLPQPGLADLAAGQLDLAQGGAGRVADLEQHPVVGQDLAHPVVGAAHAEPGTAGHGHGVGEQVVDGRAPEHRGLAAGVLGDVAADGRGPGTGRVGGEHQAVALGVLHGVLGDHPGLQAEHRHLAHLAVVVGEFARLDAVDAVELLGVDHHAVGPHRHRPAGEPGAAAAGNGKEAQFLDGCKQAGHLFAPGGPGHGHGQVEAPVGGVGGVADQGKGVEVDVGGADLRPQPLADGAPAGRGAADLALQFAHALPAQPHQVEHLVAPFRDHAPALGRGRDDVQVLAHGAEEGEPPPGRVDQFLVEKGIAVEDEQVAHAAHHQPGRTAGDPLAAQFLQFLPEGRAEQVADDQPVVGRSEIVRNLAMVDCLHGFCRVRVGKGEGPRPGRCRGRGGKADICTTESGSAQWLPLASALFRPPGRGPGRRRRSAP